MQGRNLDTELNALKNNLPPPKKNPDFLWKHQILELHGNSLFKMMCCCFLKQLKHSIFTLLV